jgi:hypothetical protein
MLRREEVYLAWGRYLLAGGATVMVWWSTVEAVDQVKKLSRREKKSNGVIDWSSWFGFVTITKTTSC